MPKSNRNCAVGGCSHTQKTCPKGRFVGFPNEDKQPERRALWIGLVQRGSKWVPTKNSRVCGCHFSGGYKVDDPSDPAYNPSIFPATPELDRRVRKTMMEEMYLQKLQAHNQRVPDLPLQPSSNQANDNDDIMKFVSAALDLSKEAGEEYVSAINSERGRSKLRALDNGPLIATGDAKEVDSRQLTIGQLDTTSMATSTAGRSAGSQLIMGGQVTADGQVTSGSQLTVDDQLTKYGQPASSNSQSRGWLYINQLRPSGSAMNLTHDSNEIVSRKRRLLHVNKPQNAIRFQRFAATSRKMSGNLSTTKHPRSMQTRYVARTGSSGVVDKSRATDLSMMHSSEQSLSSDSQFRNHILSAVNVKMEGKDASCQSQVSVQTVLSMASHGDDDSAAGWNGLPTLAHGRCHGFHGWSDICFSDTTVRRVTGVSPDVFDLLLGCLPEVMPGLPPHNSLLLFLMKLKMAVPFEFLASIFGITAPTACNIFTHILSVLITPLSDLIQWPCAPSTGPLASGTLGDSIPECSIIIDSLIIQTEHPCTEHQPEMRSTETGTDAAKVLVGLKLNGNICFLSSAYVGTATNAGILVNSELLDCLEKDSKVLLLKQDASLQQTLKAKGFRVLAAPFSPSAYREQATVELDSSPHSNSNESIRPRTDKLLTGLSKNSKLMESSTTDFIDLSIKSELVDCLPESVDGLPESVDGLPESVDGISESVDGISESVDGISESVDGLPESVDGFPESVDGFPESVDGLLECFDELSAVESPLPTSEYSNASCSQSQGTPNINSVHAGKIAQRLRSFGILNIFEDALLPYMDNVVRVCAAINNLQEPVT